MDSDLRQWMLAYYDERAPDYDEAYTLVPEKYSFWDLHVAIQDAMGWLDYHLHEFRLVDAAEQHVVSIGIPTDDDPEDRPVVPGWRVALSKFFDQRNWHAPPAAYAYDFGDDWQHALVHEGFESAYDDRTYPCCVAGEGRCPPEDWGGVHGYAEFLQVIANPDHGRLRGSNAAFRFLEGTDAIC